MRCRWSLLRAVAVIGLLATCVGLSAAPKTVRFGFEESTEEWLTLPPPAGSEMSLSLTDRPTDVKVGKHALMARYSIESRKLAALLHPVDGLAGRGIRVRLKTDVQTTLVLGLSERDGSNYAHPVRTEPGKWMLVEAPFTSFTLSTDSKDENGALDPEQVATVIIADAGGFLPGAAAGGLRTLWVDEYEATSEISSPRPKPYRPFLDTGMPSASGARATAGVSYPTGMFGQGMLADAPGELIAVPIRWPASQAGAERWDQGTIEFALSPRFDMSQAPDFAGLVTMQNEPFTPGLQGSLLIFYAATGQIGFMINGRMENVLGAPTLGWKKGEWHHVAASWGARGMRLYLDGKQVAQNQYQGGPGILAGDLVVGNHSWTMMQGHPSNTVIDELRASQVQRTDAEIAASAKATAPLKGDKDTIALDHFDGQPLPAIHIISGAMPFNATPVGKPIKLQVVVPGQASSSDRLMYTISTPVGATVRTGAVRMGALPKSASATTDTSLAVEPLLPPGFYRIDFSLRGKDREINKGMDWFRMLSTSRARASSRLFGASGCYINPEDNEAFFRYAEASGVTSLRLPFEWAEIEPMEGLFVWTKYDRIVKWADKHGVELIPTFIWENPQPAWAGRGNVKSGAGDERYAPEDLAKWSAFVFEAVDRYKDRIHWWIPANEPNLSRYWHGGPDPKAYVTLLKATFDAVRRADPKAKILGISMSEMDLGFLEGCLKEGALAYCDAIGAHPYICPHSPDERIPINIMDPNSRVGTFREGLLAVRTLIEQFGGKQKLWLDEAGQPYRDDFMTDNWGVSETKAAEYLTKIYIESLASGAVDRVLWFSFSGGEYGSFALVKPDGSPSLPMVAYTTASDRLAGAAFVHEGSRGDGIRSLVFRGGKREFEVVWCPEGEREFGLQLGEGASDMYGFPMAKANSTRRLKLTAQPVYLER